MGRALHHPPSRGCSLVSCCPAENVLRPPGTRRWCGSVISPRAAATPPASDAFPKGCDRRSSRGDCQRTYFNLPFTTHQWLLKSIQLFYLEGVEFFFYMKQRKKFQGHLGWSNKCSRVTFCIRSYTRVLCTGLQMLLQGLGKTKTLKFQSHRLKEFALCSQAVSVCLLSVYKLYLQLKTSSAGRSSGSISKEIKGFITKQSRHHSTPVITTNLKVFYNIKLKQVPDEMFYIFYFGCVNQRRFTFCTFLLIPYSFTHSSPGSSLFLLLEVQK